MVDILCVFLFYYFFIIIGGHQILVICCKFSVILPNKKIFQMNSMQNLFVSVA